ncbi:hypothetical protein BDF14DRAFT_1781032 [Spinellus fusiger]|nr:hypothetical protein BDF14DRAFT_1781032 [Spinellus fusiger]
MYMRLYLPYNIFHISHLLHTTPSTFFLPVPSGPLQILLVLIRGEVGSNFDISVRTISQNTELEDRSK